MNNNKNNIRGIWGILNKVIKNNSKHEGHPNYFIENDIEKYDMNDLAECFNKFFVNIGPNLAADIPNLAGSMESMDNWINWNHNSKFLSPVDENEVLDIVVNCKLI